MGLCSRARAQNQFLNLCVRTTRITSYCQVMVIHPAFNIIIDILPRIPKGRLRSDKLLSGADPCELVGDLFSMYPGMSRDPVQPHGVPGRDIQRLLALVQEETLFWQPEMLSELSGYHSKY